MTNNQLDNLLNAYDENRKNEKENLEKFVQKNKEKREKFNAGFKVLLSKTIRPTMTSLLAQIQKHDHSAVVSDQTETKYITYLQENYLINSKNHRDYLKITIAGNYDHEKVFILLQYSSQSSSKKNETSYELTDITAELLDEKVREGLEKILKIS